MLTLYLKQEIRYEYSEKQTKYVQDPFLYSELMGNNYMFSKEIRKFNLALIKLFIKRSLAI